MNINLKYIFYIIIVIAFFIGGYQCGSNNTEVPKEYKNTSDTSIKIESKRDSIMPKDTVYTDRWHKGKHDTLYYPLDSISCNRIYQYDDTIKRPEFDINRQIVVQGRLRDFKTEVKLKVPLKIIDSVKTTITIRDSIYLTKLPKYQLDVGIIASTNMLAPVIEFKMSNISYMAGYDPFSKKPIIGIKVRLWKSKK